MTFEERIKRIKSLSEGGAKGNEGDVHEANQLLERLRLDYPDLPLAEAYHGSIMLLIARDTENVLERVKWAKNGLKLLDKAVAAAPQDSRIRFLRGKSVYRLPEKYFQRTRTVIEDYTFLIDQELFQKGHLGTLGVNDMKLTYELGEAHRRIGRNEEASKIWKKLKRQTEDPEFRQLLREKLESLEGKPAIEHISANDGTKSLLLEKTARAAGIVLVSWVEQELKKARSGSHTRRSGEKEQAHSKRYKSYRRY